MNHSQREKDELDSWSYHLDTRSKAGENINKSRMPVDVDNLTLADNYFIVKKK